MTDKKIDPNTYWKTEIEFVFQQLHKFNPRGLIIKHDHFLPPNQIFGSLPHPNGGWVTCGLEADLRIMKIVEEHLSNLKGSSQLDWDSVLVAFRKELSDRFIGQRLPISGNLIHRAINNAVKVAERERKTITHWIPCHLVANDNPALIHAGPVTFQRISNFMQDLQPELARYINELSSDQDRRCLEGIDGDRPVSKKQREDLVDKARRYYEHFDWVAKVTISNFASRPSADRAGLCVQAALDVFRFFLGRLSGHSIDTETHGILGIEKAQFTKIKNEKLDISLYQALTVPRLNDEAWSGLIAFIDPQKPNLVDSLLKTLMSGDTPPPLSKRLLDSLNWFGQAANETSPGAAITKFVTSIEQIVQGGKKDQDGSVTKQFCDRAAAFCVITDNSKFDYWHTELKQLYGLRSNIVHGSISPQSFTLNRNIREAEKLAKRVICGAMTFFEQLDIHSEKWKTNQLNEKLDSFVHDVKQNSLSTTQETDINE
ncbi:HEPN domain-containing protein [Acetobacter okinawensis]|uniref:HEPN domain-containing protein n=1 Tax=Acetobacter okinawensis TaxID=1076594 RepID=UPI0011DD3F81|nr:HEPN domain-containing protein [Acetobacter okinawensis]